MNKIVGVCMAAVLLLSGCGETKVMEVPELIKPVSVDMDTAQVMKMDLSGVTAFSAQIVPSVEELSFLSSGSIDSMNVSIGDKVKKGQLLATLASSSGKAKKLKSEIQNMKAQNDDTNKQKQYDVEMLKENISELRRQIEKEKKPSQINKLKKQLESAKMDVIIAEEKLSQQKELQQLEIRQKERELAEAKKSVKGAKLYSPIDGEVIGTAGGGGYMVQGGNPVIKVANMARPRVRTAFVSSSQIAKANRCIAVIDGKEYEIEIEEQELSREEIERGKGLPEYSWFDFKDDNVLAEVGNSAAVELHTDSVKDALVVPVNALFGSGEEKYVYLVEGDAKTKTAVTAGTKTEAYVQLVTGVKEGDVVYVES